MTAPVPGADEGQPAYVIHTSGSTGTPNGVVATRGGFAGHPHWQGAESGLTPEETALILASVAFDAAAFELWLPLTLGARVHVVDSAVPRDTGRLRATIAEHGVAATHIVPSVLGAAGSRAAACTALATWCGCGPTGTWSTWVAPTIR
ncbi:AMP-binding protein [Streptomyces sp. A73]|uniref:AMP-binding protein n=1 Tax=unclassified Streptomyces TaxID=2593676 RepID=UPI000C179992|nr:AMP-binding protein [Streptomyces sp. RK75]MBQ1119873.1 AMP-binding protein [Streptomyces sp. B15]MBQ1160639.1 AMP-binding protein [Streptomyces sp. A73]